MRAAKILSITIIFITTLLPLKNAGANIILKKDTLSIGSEAPRFVMRDLIADTSVIMRNFTGKTLYEPMKNKERHVVVLSFWATWCQPCKNEIPVLTKLAEQFNGKPVKFFLVNTLEKEAQTEDSVRDVYHSRGYKLQCLVDAAGWRYAGVYDVHVLPVMIVIDKFGIVRKINRGYHENFQIELEKLLNELLEEKEPSKK